MVDLSQPVGSAYVDLLWIPLGAGAASSVVRTSGRAYEALCARRDGRERRELFHSALEVGLGGSRYAIEMTPQWGLPEGDRGVQVVGPVGHPALRRFQVFRYEIHRWRDGIIPDRDEAVPGPRRLSATVSQARTVLDLVPRFPPATWGRDELSTGDMWNSNSLTSWLLVRSGHDITGIDPPHRGRAPGWAAGMVVAERDTSSVGSA